MKIPLHVLLPAFFLLLLSACDGIDVKNPATFNAPFPGRNRNLEHILGSTIFLKKNKDTLAFNISGNRKNNLITFAKTGDTLFYGTVCKYCGDYYFSEMVNDTSWRIFTVALEDHVLCGLRSEIPQTFFFAKSNIKRSPSQSSPVFRYSKRNHSAAGFTQIEERPARRFQ